MIDLQMVSPIPVPVGFVVKNGSKMWFLFSLSIPEPKSSMITATSEDGAHCFDRVRNQIEKHLVQLASIGM